ncbi:unnamed protein product [Rotaria sordida]|uniref:Uncharacterized protein n=2 Tax=Rotaria sordida TaxID=392033 RepID=A0A819IQD6_9BILA|nr:unnamed protein product [Rotaria sordida]CAF3915600.1 unnamed protein product [Rotaria sordida]
MIEEGMTFSWLKQRACDDLHSSNEQKDCLMPHFLNGPEIHTEKAVIFSRENTEALQDGVANDIIRQSKWSLWNSGWRYHLVNKMENGFLTKIPEIVEYSKTCGYAEQLLEHLSNAIKGLKNPTQFSYPLNFGEVLNSIPDGKQYLQGLGRILNLSNADGWNMFQTTLCHNIEFSGASATEFKQLEFRVDGKNGTTTYLLVATNVDKSYKVTVCYAYHHIDQHILDHGGFTMQTADITLDWMRVKSCKSLATMLPSNLVPQLIYE